MKRNGLILLLAVFAPLIGSCVANYIVTCTEDSYCGTKNPGICVFAEGLPGACGVPDSTCASGYRYYKDSPAGLSNLCAVLPTFAVKPQLTETEEHKVFSVHVEVTDGNGKKFVSYKGDPVVSSDWGDARVFSFSGFSNGEADYTLWLNRETNITDGDAHISLKGTGGISGRSMGVKVKAPEWQKVAVMKFDPEVPEKQAVAVLKSSDKYKIWFACGEDVCVSDSATLNNSNLIRAEIAVQATEANSYYIDPKVVFTNNAYSMILTNVTATVGVFLSSLYYHSTDGLAWQRLGDKPVSFLPDTEDDPCSSARPGSTTVFAFTNDGTSLRSFYKNETVNCTALTADNGLTWNSITPSIWMDTKTVYGILKEGSIYRSYGLSNSTSSDAQKWIKSSVDAPVPIQGLIWNESKLRYEGFSKSPTDKYTFDIWTRP